MKHHQAIRNLIQNLDGAQCAALDARIVAAAEEITDSLSRVFGCGPNSELLFAESEPIRAELKAEIIDALRRRFGEIDAGIAPVIAWPELASSDSERLARGRELRGINAMESMPKPRAIILDRGLGLPPGVRPFDLMIGRLDRLLSEVMIAAEECDNDPDHQTLKHHADDLAGVAAAVLSRIGEYPKLRDPDERAGDRASKAGH